MATIHELYGIAAEQLEKSNLEYLKLLKLLRRVQDGEVNIENVEIGENDWKIVDPDLTTPSVNGDTLPANRL